MEITKIASDNPEMAMGLEMMKGSQTEIYFNENQHLTSTDMMGGMIKTKTFVDQNSNKMDLTMDAMGNKIWVESKLDVAEDVKQKEIAALTKFVYDKNDTKEILGYKCYKMTTTNPEMEGYTLTAYITEDIKSAANIIQGFQSVKFAGFPLEFIVNNSQFTITMSAVDIKDNFADSQLVIDTKGYKKMTMEEFKKSVGGNFGF